MLKFVKILFVALIIVLAFVSISIETPMMQRLSRGLTLSIYIRTASLLSLAALILWAWGYKQKLAASQKYTRANQILAEAETAAKRKNQATLQLEERLKASYAEKEKALEERIKEVQQECRDQLKGLKKQNLELKNTVAELMAALKDKKTNA